MEKQLGIKPEELLQRLVARPDLMAKVNDPKVQKALIEVAGQPWKAVKYLFNKDVMSVLMVSGQRQHNTHWTVLCRCKLGSMQSPTPGMT